MPPPNTRSNSPNPELKRGWSSCLTKGSGTDAIGIPERAGDPVLTSLAWADFVAALDSTASGTSTKLPQVLQLVQRPR